MGDMICTLPLIHALRRHYPQAHLAVACDAPGAPIARACMAVDETIVLAPRGLLSWMLLRNMRRVQGFDWVVAAKGGFDRRLAKLTKASGGALRVGFTPEGEGSKSPFYTEPVTLPEDRQEHQIETLLRLMKPFGIKRVSEYSGQFRLQAPAESREFAKALLTSPAVAWPGGFVLTNLSSTSRVRFRAEDFLEITQLVLETTEWSVGFVSTPADRAKAEDLAKRAASSRVAALATPGPMDLAALLERSVLLLSPEGGAAHLAAAVGTPAVVLWSEGPFDKWHSRGEGHVFVRPERGEKRIPVDRVWSAMEGLLSQIK